MMCCMQVMLGYNQKRTVACYVTGQFATLLMQDLLLSFCYQTLVLG